MDNESPIKVVLAAIGILGSVVAGFLMLMGPMISTPAPGGFVLAAAICYPVLLLLTAFVGMVSMRSALVLSLLALVCAVTVIAPYAGNESMETLFSMGAIIVSPAIALAITAGIGMREE